MTKGWAVVTGASSGIGLAFARELARRGHPVLAVARRRERLEVLSRQTVEGAGRIEPLSADLKTEEGFASVVRRVRELGAIELLVNNAGMATAGDFFGTDVVEEIGAIRLNVEAVVMLTYEVLRGMVPSGHGAIINLASVVGFQPFPHFAVYAASKAFVLEQVVKTGLQALDSGRIVKVVGGLNRFLPFLDRLLPRRTVRWLMGISAKPPRRHTPPR